MTVLASVPDSPLDRLAREIAAEHAAAERAWESAVEHGHRAGQCLLEAKALCKHGGWLPWLRDVGIPARTAQVYMRLARKYADPAHLPSTITDALDALEDRDRRAYQERMRALSADFDRAIAAPAVRAPDPSVRRYRDLMAGNPDWAWKRVEAHVQEFVGAIKDMPTVPAKSNTASELREAVVQLERLLADKPQPPRSRRKPKPPKDMIG